MIESEPKIGCFFFGAGIAVGADHKPVRDRRGSHLGDHASVRSRTCDFFGKIRLSSVFEAAQGCNGAEIRRVSPGKNCPDQDIKIP